MRPYKVARLAGPAFALFALLSVMPVAATGTTLTNLFPYPDGPTTLGNEEKKLLILGAAESASAGHLTLDAAAPTTDEWVPAGAGPDSGLAATLASVQGTPRTSYEIQLKSPLPQTYYLNLSKPVIGTIRWASTITKTATLAGNDLETTRLRAEVFVGTRRVGGDEDSYFAGGDATGSWRSFNLKFRSEVSQLDAGEKLTLRITRLSGLADFTIGTGGDHRSFLEFHYFDVDPLATALYLEDGSLVAAPTPTGDDDPPPGSGIVQAQADPPSSEGSYVGPAGLAGLGAGAPAVGLLALPAERRRRTLALLLVLALAALALSGCLSGAPKTKDDAGPDGRAQPTVSATYEDNKDLRAKGHGAVRGIVVDAEIGIAIANAHLSFLGTSLFTNSDPQGRFEFPNVTAGTYTLRVDARKYLSLEEKVTVEVGKRTLLNVSLVQMGPQELRPHRHDLYGDATSLPIADVRVRPHSSPSSVDDVPGSNYYCVGNGAECPALVPIDPGIVIPPGTSHVEVRVDWDPAGNAPREVSLRVATSGNQTRSGFVARGPNDPFHIAIFPQEADSGHQSYTRWVIETVLRNEPNSAEQQSAPLVISGRDLHVTVVAHKGVVPFEPSHRKFWNGATELTVIKDDDKAGEYLSCLGSCNLPGAISFVPDKGAFVPPGTMEVRGKVTWTTTGNLPPLVDWALLYRPANVPPANDLPSLKKVTSTQDTADGFFFTILVSGEETDQFYQSASNWKFYIDDGKDPAFGDTNPTVHGHGTSFRMTATAYKDPASRAE